MILLSIAVTKSRTLLRALIKNNKNKYYRWPIYANMQKSVCGVRDICAHYKFGKMSEFKYIITNSAPCIKNHNLKLSDTILKYKNFKLRLSDKHKKYLSLSKSILKSM